MAGAVVLAVAACGVTGPLGGAPASQPQSAEPPQPGTGVTVKMSRAPRPGSLTPGPVAPSRHRTITARHAGHVTVTTSDDGATVVLVPGQIIAVVLRSQGVLRWSPPRLAASMTEVLRRLGASGGYPTKSPARASYRAVLAGTTEILSATSARCLHARPPCAIAQRLWRVTIVVHHPSPDHR
jgi:hypothetical protein